jgi:NAD(P)-dependent dehydrogenase (short-subunit alcohol dehydrogenase family)
MDLRLDDKVALITGGSRGIGKAIATEMAASGARVMIVSRKADALEQAAAEIGNGCEWIAGNTGDDPPPMKRLRRRSNGLADSTFW